MFALQPFVQLAETLSELHRIVSATQTGFLFSLDSWMLDLHLGLRLCLQNPASSSFNLS